MRRITARPVHLARRRRRGARPVALPVLQRRDGCRRGRHTRLGRHHVVRSQDLRQLRRSLARARGCRWGGRSFFANKLGDARKIVASNQELEFTWRNSEQLQGDLVEAVTALKNEPGDRNIGMSGSVSVVRQLLAAGLLDELHLLVHPIAVRKGMRLFDEGESRIAHIDLVGDVRDRCAEPRLRTVRVGGRRRLTKGVSTRS